MQLLQLLAAIKHLSTLVERMEVKIDNVQKQLAAMQEWQMEIEFDESESESDESTSSAPATFSYGGDEGN